MKCETIKNIGWIQPNILKLFMEIIVVSMEKQTRKKLFKEKAYKIMSLITR